MVNQNTTLYDLSPKGAHAHYLRQLRFVLAPWRMNRRWRLRFRRGLLLGQQFIGDNGKNGCLGVGLRQRSGLFLLAWINAYHQELLGRVPNFNISWTDVRMWMPLDLSLERLQTSNPRPTDQISVEIGAFRQCGLPKDMPTHRYKRRQSFSLAPSKITTVFQSYTCSYLCSERRATNNQIAQNSAVWMLIRSGDAGMLISLGLFRGFGTRQSA
jgi:hypothetical protein